MKGRLILVIFLGFILSANVFAQDLVVWSLDTEDLIYSSPVVQDGVLYLGNDSGKFYAINSATGEINWQFDSGLTIRCKAAIADEIICFGNGQTLFGLNLSGEELWRFEIAESTSMYFWEFHHCSPIIVEGVAYIGTEKGNVYGVNIQTGQQVFHCQTPDAEFVIRTTPAILNNKIFFGNFDGVFFAYDLTTAEPVWNYDTKNDKTFSWANSIQDAVQIHNNAVHFAGKGCVLYALNPDNGEVVWQWRDETDQWLVGGPAIDHGLIALGSSNQYLVFGFQADTGDLLWETPVDHRVFDAPLIDESYVFASSGSFYAIDKMTGEAMQRFDVEGEIFSTAALDDGILYFGTQKGVIYALKKDVFLAKKNPKIELKDESDIDFGDVPIHETGVIQQFYVHNSGAGSDSVSVNFSGSSSIKKAIQVDPMNFNIASEDSQLVQVILDASVLKERSYSLNINIHSLSGLEAIQLVKIVTVNVVQQSAVDQLIFQPDNLALEQNYPNPFNPATDIKYHLPSNGHVVLKVFNVLGEEINTLANQFKQAGNHAIRFDASGLASGVYYYQLNFNGNKITRKMNVMF